jgi:hypothetical protein
MHRVFQRDLCKLRLATARSYVKIITDVHGPIANNGTTLRLTVASQGLGPIFKIKLSLKNTGQKPISHVPLTLTFNPQLYEVPVSAIQVRASRGRVRSACAQQMTAIPCHDVVCVETIHCLLCWIVSCRSYQ